MSKPEAMFAICGLCDKMDLAKLPAWEPMLFMCQHCPKRQEINRQQEREKQESATEAQSGKMSLTCRG